MRSPFAVWAGCSALIVTVGGITAAETDPRTDRPLVRFDPVVRQVEGWTVHVEPALLEGWEGVDGPPALRLLGNHLQRVAILVPDLQLERLREMEFWIEQHHPQLHGMQYHPSRAWLTQRGYDARLARKIHITNAAQMLSREQMLKHPAMILHELAHAYHDQVLGFDEPRIRSAYHAAMNAGIYDHVLLYTGKEVRHYAATDHKEYFAEGTEAFFYRNDFYPFVRAELGRHDPRLHELLREIWER